MKTRRESREFNLEERKLLVAHGARKVRRLIHVAEDGVEDIIFDLASHHGEYTIKNWLKVLKKLETCELTLDEWLDEEPYNEETTSES